MLRAGDKLSSNRHLPLVLGGLCFAGRLVCGAAQHVVTALRRATARPCKRPLMPEGPPAFLSRARRPLGGAGVAGWGGGREKMSWVPMGAMPRRVIGNGPSCLTEAGGASPPGPGMEVRALGRRRLRCCQTCSRARQLKLWPVKTSVHHSNFGYRARLGDTGAHMTVLG